jgi:hypothetical protein
MDPNIPVEPTPQPITPDIQNPGPQNPPVTPDTQTPFIQPTPSVPRTPTTKTKYILLGLLILLILVALGGGIYYLGVVKQQPTSQKNNNVTKTITPYPSSTPTSTPTPDPTISWKTYKDNISLIKYPSTWTIVDLPLGVKNLTCISIMKDKQTYQGIPYCSSTDQFSSIYPEYINNQNNPKITINGYDGYKDMSALGKGGFYLINPKGQFVSISPSTVSDMELFNQILSTFKFIN